MTDFTTVTQVGAIPEGQGAAFAVNGRMVAVFRHQDAYYAIDDFCPHMGAQLSAGEVDAEGVVACPWHCWRFSVKDGTWCDNPKIKTDAFELRIEGDAIQVRVPPKSPPPGSPPAAP